MYLIILYICDYKKHANNILILIPIDIMIIILFTFGVCKSQLIYIC